MRIVACTLGQALLLLAVSFGVGLGVNEVRGKNRIDAFRVIPPVRPEPAPVPHGSPTSSAPAEAPAPGTNELTFAQAAAIFGDPNTSLGLNLFVDARDDEHFETGHIPGAVQCDFYRIDYYVGEVLGRAALAEKVIVYCSGGSCEDSLLVCQELTLRDVPKERIFLFKGGWTEWTQNKMPVTTGRE